MTHPLHQFIYCPVCGKQAFRDQNEKARRCDACGFVYYFNPSAAVACFIRNNRGELLTVRRAKDPAKGTLDLPGGFVDMHESAEQAVRREVKEETGLDITTFHYLFSLPNIYPYAGFEVHTVDLFYECVADDFTNAHAADDASEIVIIPISALSTADFGLHSIRQGVEKYTIARLHGKS